MYKVTFESDVTGLASTVRYKESVFIKADTAKSARDKAEIYIEQAYSEKYAILEVIPVPVVE